MNPEILNISYGNQLRVRVCGILVEENKILMIKHHGLGNGKYLWIPPGGGMEFGTSATENLKREFLEETGLKVSVNNFLFIHEFIHRPLHALELFYVVSRVSGELVVGADPELSNEKQIIKEVKFLTNEDIEKENPFHLHQMVRHCGRIEDLIKMAGYFKIENNSIK